MKFIRHLFILLWPIMGIGCSYFTSSPDPRSNDKAYLAARSIPPLRIPPGIAASAIQSAYPVSYKQYPPSAYDVSLLPPGLTKRSA